MQEFQSFLWLILGIVLVYIVFRVAKTLVKWVLLLLLVGILLFYYEPSRAWLKKVFAAEKK